MKIPLYISRKMGKEIYMNTLYDSTHNQLKICKSNITTTTTNTGIFNGKLTKTLMPEQFTNQHELQVIMNK